MKLDFNLISLNTAPSSPIMAAQELYRKHSKIPFAIDLMDYLYSGYVVSRPTCFAMAKVTNLAKKGEPDKWAWFIRCAVGEIRQLLLCLPGKLPYICFSRSGKDDFRAYQMQRFVELVSSTKRSKK